MEKTHRPERIPAIDRGTSTITGEVFALSPYGTLVTDGDGRVVASNHAADDLLGQDTSPAGDATCCSIFGCRERGPLASACLTELAIAARKALPEIRIDFEGSRAGAA